MRASPGARAAIVRAERHRVPRLRAHHQQHVQELPNAFRSTSGTEPIGSCSTSGVENMTLAVMGCVVNGPGESKPPYRHQPAGHREAPTARCMSTARTTRRCADLDELAVAFRELVATTWKHATTRKNFDPAREMSQFPVSISSFQFQFSEPVISQSRSYGNWFMVLVTVNR